MRKRLMLVLATALIGVAAIAGVAQATPAAGVISTTIASGSLDPVNIEVRTGHWKTELQTRGQTNVTVVENRVAPGGSFGWHSHPGPSLIIVKSGTITFYRADDKTCTPDVHTAGETIVDEGKDVHIARNEGTVDLVVIVTRLLPAGAPARIDEPNPGICGF